MTANPLSYLSPKVAVKTSSIHARKIITGQDWRKKELQEKYRGFMSWYLQEKIMKDMEQFRKNGVF